MPRDQSNVEKFAAAFPETFREPGILDLRAFVREFAAWLENIANSIRGAEATNQSQPPGTAEQNGSSTPQEKGPSHS